MKVYSHDEEHGRWLELDLLIVVARHILASMSAQTLSLCQTICLVMRDWSWQRLQQIFASTAFHREVPASPLQLT